jgi:hypothetical protein
MQVYLSSKFVTITNYSHIIVLIDMLKQKRMAEENRPSTSAKNCLYFAPFKVSCFILMRICRIYFILLLFI